MTPNVVMRRIRDIELFRGCGRSQLALIDHLGVTVDIPAGRTLCTDGTPGLEFFVLLDGLVEVQTAAGRVALLHPGGWFGELALLDRGFRRATVTTVTGSLLLVFAKREFTSLLAACPSVETRVRNSAESLNHGCVPEYEPWYEPIDGAVALDGENPGS